MLSEINNKQDIIKNFMPSWFAMVMGTGIFAVSSQFYSTYIPFLENIAHWLFYFNVLLFFILLIPWTLRWILFSKNAVSDFNHPILANFFPTIAIAFNVLSSNFIIIGHNLLVGKIFWLFGTTLTIFFSIRVLYKMFLSESVKLDHLNPAWFIPPVGLIIVPVTGGILINELSGVLQEIVIVINYFSWGAGFFIYLSLLAICMYRFILHKPLPNNLVPTVWITLGPIGAGILSLLSLVQNSSFITIKEPFEIFSFIFWGFGIWWVLMAIFITIHYIKKINLPYSLSWWAFTFPLGVYVAASHKVSVLFNIELVNYIGFALYFLLFAIWIVTFIKTVKNTYTGKLFKAHK